MITGWIIAGLIGAVLATGLVYFWDDIRNWLNNIAADLVGEYLGYDARHAMQRAVVKIDRFMNRIRKRTTLFTRTNHYIDEVEIETMLEPYEIDQSVIDGLRKSAVLTQEYHYQDGK